MAGRSSPGGTAGRPAGGGPRGERQAGTCRCCIRGARRSTSGRRRSRCACAPPGDEPGGRRSQVRKYKTFYGVLKEMCAWLTECEVTHVAMEATGIYSNPVFHALAEFGDFEVIKCNPAHVKNPVPGRKTDAADCCWLGELLES